MDTISYILGMDIGQNLSKQSIEFNILPFMKGMEDAKNEDKALFTSDEKQQLLVQFSQDLQVKQQAAAALKSEKFKEEGKAFLEENAKKDGVITTESGLQYKVVQEGTGASPKETDEVTVHYTGTLIDGTKFDSSLDRGEPATFPLNRVIKGWTEGLQLMKEGAKYIFYIPSELGYGDQGAGQSIPGGSVLIFEVELIKVNSNQ